jgi:hypothetical protein
VKRSISLVLAAVSAGVMLVGCQPQGALRQITKGDELAFYDFNAPASFEEGNYGDASLRVTGGAYRVDVVTGDNTLWWGQWGDTLGDVIVEVVATQETERPETAYGVMCRVRGSVGQAREADPDLAAIMAESTPEAEMTAEATADATPEADATDESTPEADMTAEATAEATVEPPVTDSSSDVQSSYGEGDGYLFLVQGSGSFGIFRASGRALTPLVDWRASDAINAGAATNNLRAVCVGNYLAFYINDTFVADATDDSYTEGQVALVASAASRLGVRVLFDNLTVSAPAS